MIFWAKAMIDITTLDHLVLTVQDTEQTSHFYCTVFSMQKEISANGRTALHFGSCKINLHPQGDEYPPHALRPTSGAADLCFLCSTPLNEVIDHLDSLGIPVEAGPVLRIGAQGPMRSIYFRDPDGNLLEVANLQSTSTTLRDDHAT